MVRLFLPLLALAVDKSKFRACSQLSFCRRYTKLRQTALESRPTFGTAAADVSLAADKLSASVPLKRAGNLLRAEVTAYASGAMRVKITDPSESRKRYEMPAGDVLVSDLDARRVPLELSAAPEAKVSA